MTHKDFSEKMVVATQKARAYIFSKYRMSESDVEDVIQEASVKAIKNYQKFLGKCSFYTWFISICKNEIAHSFKINNRKDNFFPIENGGKELISIEPEIRRNSDIEESEFLVHEALGKLSLKHKQIIDLALKNTGTSKDIAKILKIPIASARTRLHYAKKRLKKLLLQNNKKECNKYCSFDF